MMMAHFLIATRCTVMMSIILTLCYPCCGAATCRRHDDDDDDDDDDGVIDIIAAVAERLWSDRATTDVTDAKIRLHAWRCRLLQRGTNTCLLIHLNSYPLKPSLENCRTCGLTKTGSGQQQQHAMH